MSFRVLTLIAVIVLSRILANAQPVDPEKVVEEIAKNGCAVTDQGKVKICRFDYKYKGENVEALTFRPVAEGKYPGVMFIPGFQGTVTDYFIYARLFARSGFAAMTISTPGFGKTTIKPDFIGKNTVNAYIEGFKKFRSESFIDKVNVGINGYSRGAIAASLMLTRLKDVKAAVLGGGIYDLKKAYYELTVEGIKANIKTETGLAEKALRERSAIFGVKKINCPILIIHGEKDLNAPTSQAYLLRDELKRLGKEQELQIVAGADHYLRGGKMGQRLLDFFTLKLMGKVNEVKINER